MDGAEAQVHGDPSCAGLQEQVEVGLFSPALDHGIIQVGNDFSNHHPTPTMPAEHVLNEGAGVPGFISLFHFQQQHKKRCFRPFLYSSIQLQHEAAHKPD